MPRRYHHGRRRTRKGKGAKLSKRQKKEVKRLIVGAEEVKYFDQDLNPSYAMLDRAFTNWNAIALTSPAQGDAAQQRVGDEIEPKYLDFRYSIYMNSALQIAPQHVARVIIVKWNLSDTVLLPSVPVLLQTPSAGAGSYDNINSPYNMQGLKQRDFHVVYDRRHTIGSGTGGAAVHHRIKCRGKIRFDYGQISGEGKYYLFACSDDSTGAHTPALNMAFYSRLTYTDG